MINRQCLELPVSRANFYGPKDVRAIFRYDCTFNIELQYVCGKCLDRLSIMRLWYDRFSKIPNNSLRLPYLPEGPRVEIGRGIIWGIIWKCHYIIIYLSYILMDRLIDFSATTRFGSSRKHAYIILAPLLYSKTGLTGVYTIFFLFC